MKELQKIIGLGIGIVGVITAANSLSSQVKSAERKGVDLVGGIMLFVAGATLFVKVEDVWEDAQSLMT